jgi:hypothetical protein
MPSSSAMASKFPRGRIGAVASAARSASRDSELSKSQLRELDRRLRDYRNPTRYLLATVFTPRFVLYYNVSNDTFGMTEPDLGTLFKRRAAAMAIRRLLRPDVRIVECRVDRHGRVIKSSVPRLRPTWRRSVARPRHQGAADRA